MTSLIGSTQGRGKRRLLGLGTHREDRVKGDTRLEQSLTHCHPPSFPSTPLLRSRVAPSSSLPSSCLRSLVSQLAKRPSPSSARCCLPLHAHHLVPGERRSAGQAQERCRCCSRGVLPCPRTLSLSSWLIAAIAFALTLVESRRGSNSTARQLATQPRLRSSILRVIPASAATSIRLASLPRLHQLPSARHFILCGQPPIRDPYRPLRSRRLAALRPRRWIAFTILTSAQR